jgi:aminoacrylate hydrolase
MSQVSIGDAEIYTEIHGEGEELLLVAGLGGRAQFWDAQIAPLSRHFRVIVHDHRGCGRSTRSKIVYGAEQMAEDVLRLMDALRIERAHLVGHSTGGSIGQHIALKHPERLGNLVLSGSWAGPDELFTQLFRLRREVLISCGPAAYLMLGTLLATPAWFLQERFVSANAFLEQRLADFPGLEIELSRISAVMSHDLRSHVHNIRARTLVIGAEDDQITPIGFSRELARRIPGARLLELPRGGHFAPMVVAERYAQAVLDFLLESQAHAPADSTIAIANQG